MKFLLVSSVFLVIPSIVELRNTGGDHGLTDTRNNSFKGNILNFLLITSPSHHLWNARLMQALAEEGYNVTSVSVYVDKEPTNNLRYIHLEKGLESMQRMLKQGTLTFSRTYSTEAPVESLRMVYDWMYWNCIGVIESNGFQTLMKYPDDMKFDLIIYETSIGPCLLPILDKFPKAPLMSTIPFIIPPYAFYLTGSPTFPSFLPHYTYPYPTQNLIDRMYSLYLYAIDIYIRKSKIFSLDKNVRKYFGPNMQYLGLYEERNEVFLVNTHPSMQPAQPLMPNLIEVGGLHIRNKSSLPNEIEHFISSSNKGAVLFSLGTNIKTEILGEDKLQMIINIIRRLPQYNFLLKLDLPSSPSLPKNLMVKDFMPQNDILAHPKIKLFLSHTGLLSTQEAVYHGVPVLAMPFFLDQFTNANGLVKYGVAEQLDFFKTNEEEIYKTITKMLKNSSYAQNMKQLSRRFRDRPQHPLDLALFWCRYLIRNGNAQHLRSPAREMSHFVQHMWDLLLILLSIAVGVVLLIIKLICVIAKKKKNIKVKTN